MIILFMEYQKNEKSVCRYSCIDCNGRERREEFHKKSIEVRNELKICESEFLTTNAVIFELAGYFSQSQNRSTAIRLTEVINQSKKWNCILVDDNLMKRGFDRFKKMSDKN